MKVTILFLTTLAYTLAEPPVNNYLPPSNQYGAPSRPSNQYGLPGSNGQTTAIIKPNVQYGTPNKLNQQYGAPDYNANAGYNGNNGYQGGRNNGGYDDGPSEPANYNFEYHVQDAYYGTDFGHQESRQGDVAQGRYFVLLPDGRRQIVDYVADQDGYKPKISYEGTARADAGYAKGGAGGYNNAGNGGYSNGGNGGYNNGGNGGNGGYSNGGYSNNDNAYHNNNGGNSGNGGYQY